MKFAMKLPVPDAQAAIELHGMMWPQRNIDNARENAKRCKVFGFWRLKSLKVVPECSA